MKNRRYVFDSAPHHQKTGVSSFNKGRGGRTRTDRANTDEDIGSQYFF
jgi:hypothetical protein